MSGILWTIIVVLFVIWVIGLILRIGGKLIHLLLVLALVLLVWNLITGNR
ncbi:lmo0937 family membrane protein [Listeria booriae]|uniref:Lmo0937 family membrane protein n=1 Tax=Listeria booriae TaxID=1552123 RepID=A0A7X1CEJ5_9LIST|nr:lmo0937 family membrane protein [Listeria booriae]MBC1561420.1 lmo0937 family membrane protein [Listeria booriae]MBC1973871.1 lmo0937 family membrane protein [Listeria booriae]MBC2031579.1 lmo0937 family membrane protein [Listeria booriae]